MTQILARTTTLLDGRKKVKMTGRIYLRAILPIGFFFSLSLICGNKAYLYLSVAFIQMLKVESLTPQAGVFVDFVQATTPVAVLLSTWSLGVASPNLKTLGNVSFIVIGVMIATYGEIAFVLTGFLYQAGGLVFEAIRLTLVERLLSSAEFMMDPLVSLYYFAPVCAIMNGVTSLIFEVPVMHMSDIYKVGFGVLLANAMVAFLLNVSVVFLVCCLHLPCVESITDRLTDWQNFISRPYSMRRTKGYHACLRLDVDLGHTGVCTTILRLQHRSIWYAVLQARRRAAQRICKSNGPFVVGIWCSTTRPSQGGGLFGHPANDLYFTWRFGTHLRS